MISKKYGEDYAVTLSVNDRGRTVEKLTYQGEWFWLTGVKNWRKAKLIAAGWAFFLTARYLLTGFTGGASGRVWYVVLPYVLGFLPAVLLTAGGYRALRCGRKMKREERDHGWLRMRLMGFWLLAFVLLTVAGEAFFLIKNPAQWPREWPFFCLGLGTAAGCGFFDYSVSKKCRNIRPVSTKD